MHFTSAFLNWLLAGCCDWVVVLSVVPLFKTGVLVGLEHWGLGTKHCLSTRLFVF